MCDTLLTCIVATGVLLPMYCLGPKGLLTPEKFSKILSHEAFPYHGSDISSPSYTVPLHNIKTGE